MFVRQGIQDAWCRRAQSSQAPQTGAPPPNLDRRPTFVTGATRESITTAEQSHHHTCTHAEKAVTGFSQQQRCTMHILLLLY
jgi:hypothetical protein